MNEKTGTTIKLFEAARKRLAGFGKLRFITLSAVIAIGFGLRLVYLKQPLVHDEAFTYMAFASPPLSIGLSFYPTPNNHLLNTLLIHIFCNVVPCGGVCPPWLIRLPAFISGILVMPSAYFASKRLYNKNVALITTALVAVSTPLIEYSTMARGYSFVALAFLLLIILADRLMRKPGFLYWALFVLISVLGFYAVPVMLYYFTAVILWMLVSWIFMEKPERKPVFIGQLALSCTATVIFTALLYLPVINKSGLSSITANDWVKALPFSEFIREIPTALNSTWSFLNLGGHIVITVILLIGVLTSFFTHGKMGKHKVNIAYPTLICCIVIMLLSRNLPFARVWLPLIPLYLCLASAGLYRLGNKWISFLQKKTKWKLGKPVPVALILLIIITLALGGLVITTGEAYQPGDQGPQFRDAEKITVFLKDELGSEDITIYSFVPATMLRYYFLLHNVPLDHLYISPEYMPIYNGIYGQSPVIEEPDRAFIIESESEGYPLDAVLEYAGLEEMKPEAGLLEKFPDSRLYIIDLKSKE